MRVRSISGWAVGAMVGIGGFAVLYLLGSLLPLAEAWSARHRAAHLDVITWAGTAVTVASAAAFLTAAACFMVWLARARANLGAFFGARPNTDRRFAVAAWFIPMANLVLPAAVVVDVAVHSGELGARAWRRRTVRLVWAWWASFVAALLAVVGGLITVATNADELADLRARMAAGAAYDAGLTGDLLARLVVSRLPAAALFVVAAALALVVTARITSAHYLRIDQLRNPFPVSQAGSPVRHEAPAPVGAEAPAPVPLPVAGGTINA